MKHIISVRSNMKNTVKNISCIFMIFSIVSFIQCCAGLIYEPYHPTKVENSKNTYVRFTFKNVRSQYDISAFRESSLRMFDFYYYNFIVKMWTRDEVFPTKMVYRTINPVSDYWKKYYRNDSYFYRRAANSIYFVEGCEYKMPIPAGANRYLFSFWSEYPSVNASKISALNVPENHSVRVEIDLNGSKLSQEEKNHLETNGIHLNRDSVSIKLTIEPNPRDDEDRICEIPVTQ